jgi:hypothetical protein
MNEFDNDAFDEDFDGDFDGMDEDDEFDEDNSPAFMHNKIRNNTKF